MEDKNVNIKNSGEATTKTNPAANTADNDTPNDTTSSHDETSTPKLLTESTTTAVTTMRGSRLPILPFIAGVVAALLAWQLYNVVTTTTSLSDAGYPDPVATINGVAVDQSLFEQNVSETLSQAAAQGFDTSDEAVRSELEAQSLDVIINTRLLVNAAKEAGYEASDEEVAEKISQLEAQFGGAEALDEQLTQLGLDRDRLAADIREQIIVDKLLQNDVLSEPINVTEEEITEVYEALQAAGQEMPPLETVRDAIIVQIEQQKQQKIIEEYLDTLREQADIQINL